VTSVDPAVEAALHFAGERQDCVQRPVVDGDTREAVCPVGGQNRDARDVQPQRAGCLVQICRPAG